MLVTNKKKKMKPKIILIMGLVQWWKTTLASKLGPLINAKWLNAEGKKKTNDWDFSNEGRRRQSNRMNNFALEYLKKGHQ